MQYLNSKYSPNTCITGFGLSCVVYICVVNIKLPEIGLLFLVNFSEPLEVIPAKVENY